MLKCLITGATGLIGKKVLEQLQEQYDVYVIFHNDNEKNLLADSVNHIMHDLSNPVDSNKLPEKMDVIIHLAQSEHFREFPDRAIDVFNVNTLSTLHLLDYAGKSGVKKFIYASSGGIYGTGEHGFKEDEHIIASGDLGFYLGTKLCSEVILKNYSSLMDIIILRFFFVYGPGQRKSMLIPRLVESVKNGKPVTLQGNDGIKINPTFVDDAAMSVVKAVSLEGSYQINVAGPAVYTLREIAEIIGREMNITPVFDIDSTRTPNHVTANIENMCKMLHEPVIIFEEGIKSVIEDMRGNNE